MDEPMITSDGAVDAELVSSYLAGDRSALGSIYDRYGQSLFDTATAMTNNRDDASDMVQDVFVLAAERLGQLRDPARLKPWLFAILRNEVYRRSRRRSRQAITDFSAPEHDAMLPSTPSSSDAVDDALEGAELAELVRAAASGLDARDQLVLELSVRQGLSGDDLADALGVSAQQSYGLVHRMRERTERSLGAYCVARRSRKECDELDAILKGWSGDFTVLLRKKSVATYRCMQHLRAFTASICSSRPCWCGTSICSTDRSSLLHHRAGCPAPSRCIDQGRWRWLHIVTGTDHLAINVNIDSFSIWKRIRESSNIWGCRSVDRLSATAGHQSHRTSSSTLHDGHCG